MLSSTTQAGSTVATSSAELTTVEDPSNGVLAQSEGSASSSGVAFSTSVIRKIGRSQSNNDSGNNGNGENRTTLTSISGAEGGDTADAETRAITMREPRSVELSAEESSGIFAATFADAESNLTDGDETLTAFAETGSGDQAPLRNFFQRVFGDFF